MATAREDLLERTIGFVAGSGMGDLSLREIAAGVGTSHRMLIYHFGSREGLVAAIVEFIEEQQRTALDGLATQASSPRELLMDQWAQLSDPDLRPFVLLFFEVLALALHRRPGTEEFLDTITTPWLDHGERIAARLDMVTDRDELRLGVAVVRGLLIEALASGEYEAPTASFHRFIDMWDEHRADRS